MRELITDFITAYIIALMAWFFGGLDGFIKVLLAFSVVDYFSGLAVAWTERKINSRVGFKGILKKCVMFSLVGIANLLGGLIGGSDAVRTVVILFYIGNEGISIMENAFRLGVPFPKALRDKFEQFRDDNKEDDSQKGGESNGSIDEDSD